MSDNSNLANSNNEPSMEDILSSIRKVIAEDLVNEEAVPEEDAPEEAVHVETGDDTAVQFVDNAKNAEDFPIVEKTATFDETDILDLALETTPDTDLAGIDLPDTNPEDILDLESIITELPDPHAMVDETGEVLELVTLEDDLTVDLTDGSKMELEEVSVNSEIETTIETDANTVAETTEMDMVMAANANKFAQTEAYDQVESNDDDEFDEALDLVMDSDASDYVTTKVSSGEMEIEDWRDQAAGEIDAQKTDVQGIDTDILAFSTSLDTDVHTVVDEVVQETLAESLEETLLGDADELAVLEQNLLEQDDYADTDESESKQAAVTPDEDMDLVKSLLDDLMDEPVSDPVQEPVSKTESHVDVETIDETMAVSLDVDTDISDFTDEILFAEPANHDLDDQDIIIPEPPNAEIEIMEQVEPDLPASAQSTLAQIAADMGETSGSGIENTPNPDDIVTLKDPGLVSKLALTGGVAAAAAVATVATADQDAPMKDETESTILEPEIQDSLSTPIPPQTSKQEEEPMATPLKTETLSDADTQEETSSAFASLTSAVQEQALAEENGPPIGELVKEALKPMLQEWLDNNLKAMVQRAVTKEIKRISSGK